MKKNRITIYIAILLYVLATVFFHLDFMYKKAILYSLIAILVIFDLIIPSLRKYFNSDK